MKKRMISFLIMAVTAAFLFAGCSQGGNAQKKIDEKLAQAEEALSRYNYDGAILLYEQAGEAGREGIAKAYTQKLYLRYTKTHFDPETVEQVENEIKTSDVSLETVYNRIWDNVREAVEEVEAYFDAVENGTYDSSESFYPILKINDIKTTLENLEANGHKADAQIMSALYTVEAKEKLNWGEEKLLKGYYDDAEELWSKCSEGTEGNEIAKAIRLIKGGQAGKALEQLENLIYDIEFIGYIFEENEPDFDVKDNAVLWEYTTTLRELSRKLGTYEEKDLAASMSEAEQTRFSISHYYGNSTLTESERSALPQEIGTNPKGKVLILNRRRDFEAKDTTMDVYFLIMKSLPEKYYPYDYSEVEYIILVDSNYSNAGVYNTGTRRLRESSKMTVYHVPTEKTIYTKNVQGELPESVIYTSRIRRYESNSVDMSGPLKEAAKKIIEHQ